MPITLPRDDSGETVQIGPSAIALATTYDTTVSGTTQVTFNTATTLIRVSAISQPILLRWGTSAAVASSNNFDRIILAGQCYDFYIPRISGASTLYTAANFIEQAASATLIVEEF